MLHYHGQWFLKDMVVDLVWPDFQQEKAVNMNWAPSVPSRH